VTCNQEVFPLQDTASAWSVWTDCTASCGGGTRSRSRQCPSSLTDCRSSETENCNTELCQRCRISTASRSSCGTIGGSRAACEALGCCYDLNQCYRAG
uniref:P-type domain-containing protein n=1 Tax=Ciona savignyi TaxID=51511 RepID=H2ZLK3_CIOSA